MMEREPLEMNAEEKLGEYLKRARLAAGVDAAELAREIRITVEMLDHLEAGRYEKLPVEAYVRGYLNTICTRLDLDRSKVLDWFANEVGSKKAVAASAVFTTANSTRPTGASPAMPNKPVMILLATAVVAFFVVINLRNQTQEDESLQAARLTESLDSLRRADSLLTDSALSPSDTAGLTADSLVPSSSSSSADTTAGAAPRQETVLRMDCIKDSTWVRVKKVGGLTWAKVLHRQDKPRVISHNDTMKVTIGYPDRIRLFVNDTEVAVPGEYFRVINGQILRKGE